LRPERYTILKEIEMTERKAMNLAKSTNVIWFKKPLVQELFLL
jgi:glycerol dehydrogenase-like iron-containing ADH family enzyme